MTSPTWATGLVEARLRLALEAAGMGLWDWDVSSGTLVWDERSAAMYGTTLAESTGSIADVDARVHPDDLPRVRAVLAAAIETAGIVDVEFRVVWPDGSLHWLYGRGQALIDGTGAVVRLIGANLDVTDQRRHAQQSAQDAARLAGLVAVAQALGHADTETDVLQVVTDQAARLLGASGAVLCLTQPDGPVRALTTSFFDRQVQTDIAELPVDAALPMVDAAVTGRTHFLTDRAAAAAAFPGADQLYRRAHTDASAAVPLSARGQVFGSLSAAFDRPHDWRRSDRELLETFAAVTAQALDRIRAREAEQRANRVARQFSEALQRSLLTDPLQPDHLQLAVRYQPAAEEAQVGGDWYDAFLVRDGGTCLVIGDVAGHDQHAAAAMGQLRNLLRGIGYTVGEPPAHVLGELDRAMRDLAVGTLATAVLARIEQTDRQAADGTRTLRWSNAGHPPPLLIGLDGTVELLSRPADLLLGLDPETDRSDHTQLLVPGATVLLYTDGLVERRGMPLDEGLDRLVGTARRLARLPLEALCDALLDELATDVEDDVSLLALRAHPEDRPRPTGAGAQVLPADLDPDGSSLS